MPKTVPKSSNDEHRRNLASVPRGGATLNAGKRKLEPNGEDPAGSSRKRPNRAETVDQRGRSAEEDQRRRLPPSPPPPVLNADQEAADQRSNYLLEALRRIQQLQDEIEFLENDPYEEDGVDDDSEDESGQFYGQDRAGASAIVGRQAEALGFAVCARETMAFLEREGVPRDAPMMVNLRARLIGEGN